MSEPESISIDENHPLVSYLSGVNLRLQSKDLFSDETMRRYMHLSEKPDEVDARSLLELGVKSGYFFNNMTLKLAHEGGLISLAQPDKNDEAFKTKGRYANYHSSRYIEKTRNEVYQDYASALGETLKEFADKEISRLSTVTDDANETGTAESQNNRLPDAESELIKKLLEVLSLPPDKFLVDDNVQTREDNALNLEALDFLTSVYRRLRAMGYTHYDLWQ